MQLTIDATPEELEELAKMAYVAQFIFDSSGKFSTGFKYSNMPIFKQALRKINKALLQAMPDIEILELDEKNENVFTHSIKMEPACREILLQFSEDTYLNRVCTELTRRDYRKKTGQPTPEIIFPGGVYSILYDNNMAELKANGLSNFTLAG